jgi:ubiquitin C-terminal hydrolase
LCVWSCLLAYLGTFSFPEELDMAPYLVGSRAEDSIPGRPATLSNYNYSLFGIVNHHGSLQNGHYTSYVKHVQAVRMCARKAVQAGGH